MKWFYEPSPHTGRVVRRNIFIWCTVAAVFMILLAAEMVYFTWNMVINRFGKDAWPSPVFLSALGLCLLKSGWHYLMQGGEPDHEEDGDFEQEER